MEGITIGIRVGFTPHGPQDSYDSVGAQVARKMRVFRVSKTAKWKENVDAELKVSENDGDRSQDRAEK